MRDETARDVFLRRLRIFPRGNLKRQDSENIPRGTNSRFVNLDRRRDWFPIESRIQAREKIHLTILIETKWNHRALNMGV